MIADIIYKNVTSLYKILSFIWPIVLCTFLCYAVSFAKYCKVPQNSEAAPAAEKQLLLSGLMLYAPIFLLYIFPPASVAAYALFLVMSVIEQLKQKSKTVYLFLIAATVTVISTLGILFMILVAFNR